MPDKVITAKTPLEKAALRAVFLSASGNWFGTFVDDATHFLYEDLGLVNDDEGAQLDMDRLSEILIKWAQSVNYD